MAGRWRWFARLWLLAATVVVAACGVSTPSAAPTTRPNLPNGPIDIGGGRHLNINCGGSGDKVVILDGGLGNTSAVWTSVVRLVQPFATVCSYDRAGQGASDSRPLPHGAESAVDDLHALLVAGRLPGPYVLVGASFGGLVVQIFARRFPTETAGVVLVDSLGTGWDPRLEAILSPAQVAERRAIPNGEEITNEEIRASEVAAGAGPAFPNVPLVVLRHGQPFPGGPDWPTDKVEALWATVQAENAALSSRSVSLVAAQSGHRIHEQQADLVADAVHAIVDPSRWPPTVPSLPPAFGAGASPVAAGTISGSFVFAATDGLHMAAADGSGSKVIVANGDGLVGEPSLDASGRLVAYDRRPKPAPGDGPQGGDLKSEIWAADTATGAAHRVSPTGQMPRVSPNGSWIAFEDHGHTFLVKPDGTGLRDLGAGGCATWSPDSTHLAMCTADDTVFVLAIADGHKTTIVTGPGPFDPTAWSPDGTTIALFGSQDGTGEIYLVDADGAHLRRLTTAPGNQLADPWIGAGLIVTSSLPGADVSDWFLVDPVTGTPSVIPWMRGIPNPIAYLAPR